MEEHLNTELALNMDNKRDEKMIEAQVSLNPDFYDLARFNNNEQLREVVIWKDVQTKLLFQKYQSKY